MEEMYSERQAVFCITKVLGRLVGLIFFVLLLSVIVQKPANAHRGAKNEIDTLPIYCRR